MRGSERHLFNDYDSVPRQQPRDVRGPRRGAVHSSVTPTHGGRDKGDGTRLLRRAPSRDWAGRSNAHGGRDTICLVVVVVVVVVGGRGGVMCIGDEGRAHGRGDVDTDKGGCVQKRGDVQP